MSDTRKKTKRPAAAVIVRRELSAYFASPIAYIVSGLFLIFSGFLFFNTFFLANRAELRNFFTLLPGRSKTLFLEAPEGESFSGKTLRLGGWNTPVRTLRL